MEELKLCLVTSLSVHLGRVNQLLTCCIISMCTLATLMYLTSFSLSLPLFLHIYIVTLTDHRANSSLGLYILYFFPLYYRCQLAVPFFLLNMCNTDLRQSNGEQRRTDVHLVDFKCVGPSVMDPRGSDLYGMHTCDIVVLGL